MRVRFRKGFTLIELVVTILIIGILTSFAVPQYLMTVETGYADDAVAVANMIGTTNKMFALDHQGSYVTGIFPATCAGTVCMGPGWQTNPCTLVACKYLADQDWSNKKYLFYACDGSTPGTCGGMGGGNQVAAAHRNGGYSPYSGWGYTMSASGVIQPINASVPQPTY